MTDSLVGLWSIDPSIDYLNHASFGACPTPVLEAQTSLRRRLEREPVRFLAYELDAALAAAKSALAEMIGADGDDMGWVANATTGVNSVLRSLSLDPGDEIVVTDHGYNACNNAAKWVADRAGARVVVASIPFPIDDEHQALAAIEDAVSPRTRLVIVDHVTSSTALVLPVARIVAAMNERGIDTLIDGAHGPGLVDVEVDAIGAAYYTGNCHKWLCAPKGAAFLHVRRDRQDGIVPTVISNGANAPLGEKSRFSRLFSWLGTVDPTPFLCVPVALSTLADAVDGGWPEIRRRNRALCLVGRDLLVDALDIGMPAPASMVAAMASIPIGNSDEQPLANGQDPLADRLFHEAGIEVPIVPFPWPRRVLRISAQLYNKKIQYERLAVALRSQFARDGALG